MDEPGGEEEEERKKNENQKWEEQKIRFDFRFGGVNDAKRSMLAISKW